jgi:predicted transposase YdaD
VSSKHPHDALFHSTFSQVENAVGEFRAVLPAALALRVDWSTLRLQDGHYVDEELGCAHSDLLYHAQADGMPIAIYLLFEHQSTADPLMPYRLLRYMVRIWERWLLEHPGAKHLPMVVPVVLSHAEGGWGAPTHMHELFELPPELFGAVGVHLPEFSFVLDDLALATDQQLRARALRALALLTLLLLRDCRSGPNLAARLADWSDAFRAVWAEPHGREALRTVIHYLALATELKTLQDVGDVLVPMLGQEAGEVVMTVGQRLIEEGHRVGRAEGRLEGKAEGEAEGKAEGKAEAVLTILAGRAVMVSDSDRERISSCRDLSELDRWMRASLTATRVADLFRLG